MSAPRIDTADFTRRGERAHGRLALPALARLASMLEPGDAELGWRLEGRSLLRPDGSRQGFLQLRLEGRVPMRCVRCLEPVEVALDVSRDYRLVSSEAQAEAEDLDDEAFDLLVGGRGFDVAGLVEDEAIMALPPAPRHDDCRTAAASPEAPDGSGTRRPFESLKGWRDDGRG
jgi:uncharacterized protein